MAIKKSDLCSSLWALILPHARHATARLAAGHEAHHHQPLPDRLVTRLTIAVAAQESAHLGEHADGRVAQWHRTGRPGISCIAPRTDLEATARPSVMKLGRRYRMWRSRRDIVEFRTHQALGYRGGYAESADGLAWERIDDAFGLEPAAGGW